MGIVGVYKYVYHGEVIYIGKSDKSIDQRIKGHSSEDRFKPYLQDCQIYYYPLDNPAQTTVYEILLINKYKPFLNSQMKYEEKIHIELPDIQWCKYKKQKGAQNEITKLKRELNKSCNVNLFRIDRVDFETCLCANLGELFIEVSGLNTSRRRKTVYVWQDAPYVWQFFTAYCESIDEVEDACFQIYQAYKNNAQGEAIRSPFNLLFDDRKYNIQIQKAGGEKWQML